MSPYMNVEPSYQVSSLQFARSMVFLSIWLSLSPFLCRAAFAFESERSSPVRWRELGELYRREQKKELCLYMNLIVKESGSKGYLRHSPPDTMDIRVHHQTAEVTGGVLDVHCRPTFPLCYLPSVLHHHPALL